VDETYIRVKGQWCYLYRGIDEDGNLVDVLLREKRDLEAAKAFFQKAAEPGEPPEEVLTDGHAAYPRAIAEVLGKPVKHRTVKSVHNPIEQSHRGIKQRYYPTLGLGELGAAQRFCEVVEEVKQFLRVRKRMGEFVSLPEKQSDFCRKIGELRELM